MESVSRLILGLLPPCGFEGAPQVKKSLLLVILSGLLQKGWESGHSKNGLVVFEATLLRAPAKKGNQK